MRSQRPLTLCCVLALLAVASSAAADWKLRAVWCASDAAVTQGGDIATNLQVHANAHQRYCRTCRGGADQYDSVLACYAGDGEKMRNRRAEVEAAGRDAVNRFMRSKTPSCCETTEEENRPEAAGGENAPVPAP